MKKVLLLVVGCWLMVGENYANSLLTRREIFNFNVGDTFDYQMIGVNPDTSFYSRIIVTGKYVNATNDTIIYELNGNISVSYTDLDSIESFMHKPPDTSCLMYPNIQGHYADGLIVTNACMFFCSPSNFIHWWGEGVGTTYANYYNGTGERLRYFSKGNITWGTPIVSGVSEVPNPQSDFRLSPNPAPNTVTISIDEEMVGATATLSDITGRKMAAVELTTGTQELSTANFASGVYFVTIANNEGGNATKKLVISN